MRCWPCPRLKLASLALIAALGCGSNTDITRTDNDVEEWVAEQQADEKERRVRPSKLGHAPPASTAPQASGTPPAPTTPQGAGAVATPCSRDWYTRVEGEVHVLDAEGHGPDLGSEEWKSAVEHRLGVADEASFPALGTPAWCDAVDQRVLHQ